MKNFKDYKDYLAEDLKISQVDRIKQNMAKLISKSDKLAMDLDKTLEKLRTENAKLKDTSWTSSDAYREDGAIGKMEYQVQHILNALDQLKEYYK